MASETAGLQQLATNFPAIVRMLLRQFSDRESLRLYVLEVASLFPNTREIGSCREFADALLASSGRSDGSAAAAELDQWNEIFPE